jgi:hypothetical protein
MELPLTTVTARRCRAPPDQHRFLQARVGSDEVQAAEAELGGRSVVEIEASRAPLLPCSICRCATPYHARGGAPWTVKASRPLICVLVINDNHCGLTFLLRYKNRLVR